MGNKKRERNIKKEIEVNSSSNEVKSLIIITISVLSFLVVFYLFSSMILNRDVKKDNDADEVEIQFDEVLVGTSFSLRPEEYYVLYYETEDEDVSVDLASAVSSYRSSDSKLSLYIVDMSNAINASFISEKSNSEASNPSELQIAGPTLIKFNNGSIVEYIEGVDKVLEKLK